MFTAVELVADVMRQVIAFAGTIDYAAVIYNCRDIILQNEDIFLFICAVLMVSFILSLVVKIAIVTVHVIKKAVYTAKKTGRLLVAMGRLVVAVAEYGAFKIFEFWNGFFIETAKVFKPLGNLMVTLAKCAAMYIAAVLNNFATEKSDLSLKKN